MAKRNFEPVRPGMVLAGDFLKGMEISQYRLAKGIGVSPRRINEIVQGKRGITANTALRSRPLAATDSPGVHLRCHLLERHEWKSAPRNCVIT